MKPTTKLLKEFWEWCGIYWRGSILIREELTSKGVVPVVSQEGWYYGDEYLGCHEQPPIDLNNLFKYAVPKLKAMNRYHIGLQSEVNFPDVYLATVRAHLNPDAYPMGQTQDKDPALALFWAIYEAIKEASHSKR